MLGFCFKSEIHSIDALTILLQHALLICDLGGRRGVRTGKQNCQYKMWDYHQWRKKSQKKN